MNQYAELGTKYDWIVIGEHPAALLSAAFMSKSGYSVLVVGMDSVKDSHVSEEGDCIDPESNWLLGLGENLGKPGLIRDLLIRLGVSFEKETSYFDSEQDLPQILTPQIRIRTLKDQRSFLFELERELGRELNQKAYVSEVFEKTETSSHSFWKKYLKEMDAQIYSASIQTRLRDWFDVEAGPVERSSSNPFGMTFDFNLKEWSMPHARLKDLVDRCGSSEVRDLILGWAAATHRGEEENPILSELTPLLSVLRRGAGVRGGMRTFRNQLKSLAKKHGATIVSGEQLQRIFIEDRVFVGVQLKGNARVIQGRSALYSGRRSQLNHLVHRSQIPSSGFRQKAPHGWRFTLALTVNEEAIPPGLNRRSIWKEKGAPALEIEMASPSDYGMGVTGRKLIFARTVLPYHPDSLKIETQRRVASQMFQQLSELLPFLEFHVVDIFPDFRKSYKRGDDEFSLYYGFVSPEFIPENLCVYEGRGEGVFTGIQRLYGAAGESFPCWGNLGPYLAALESIRIFVSESSGEKTTFGLTSEHPHQWVHL